MRRSARHLGGAAAAQWQHGRTAFSCDEEWIGSELGKLGCKKVLDGSRSCPCRRYVRVDAGAARFHLGTVREANPARALNCNHVGHCGPRPWGVDQPPRFIDDEWTLLLKHPDERRGTGSTIEPQYNRLLLPVARGRASCKPIVQVRARLRGRRVQEARKLRCRK